MAIALGATGYWMYIDVPQTPTAVVICVIVFNAAFGYRKLSFRAAPTEVFIELSSTAGDLYRGSTLPRFVSF
jgi:fumarate reductase subunit C